MESGIALVVAVLITSALVAIGSFAMVMTNTELDISRNDRFGREAFFFTDGGGAIYTKIIDDVYWNNNVSTERIDYPNIQIENNFLDELYRPGGGYEGDGPVDSPDNAPDITFTDNQDILEVDVDFRFQGPGKGSSLLTHMGYEGIGINKSFGGAESYYDIETRGTVNGLAQGGGRRGVGSSVAHLGAVFLHQ